MKTVWTWEGKFFGYIKNEDLFTYNGNCVGRINDNNIYGESGEYVGEIRNDNRLITHQGKKNWRGSPARNVLGSPIARYVDYVGYVMYAGYEDFPAAENF